MKMHNQFEPLLRLFFFATFSFAVFDSAEAQTDVQQLMAQPGVLNVSDRTNRTGASGVDPLYNSHGSTIIQTANGNLMMAYYCGGFEGANNQSIYISTEAAGSSTWSPQVLVAGNPSASFTTQSTPVIAEYNPVLFQPTGGPLYLYYKMGTEASWLGYYITSTNSGQTWSAPTELPTGIAAYDNSNPAFPLDNVVLGPIRSKPVQLSNGNVLFGQSIENDTNAIYGSYILTSTSATNPFGTGNWSTTPNIDPTYKDSIQPTFIYHSGPDVEVLTRMYSGNAGTYIGESLSTNYGATFSNVVKTPIPNNWSGIEGLGLADGRDLLFCNPDNVTSAGNGRNLLVALVSTDGTQWHAALQLENVAASTNDEFDYPAAIQTNSGQIQITYSNNHAGIRDVAVDPTQIRGLPLNTSNPNSWQWPAQFYAMATSPAYLNLTEDDANSNSGYITKGSTLSGNSFGWQSTQHAQGYTAGEIGGTFSRTAIGASYFGRPLGNLYNQNSSLIASGQLYKTPGSGTTDLYLGFFNSTDLTKADFIGLDLSGSTGTANILDSAGGNGASSAGEASQSIGNSAAYQYSMIYTPAAGSAAAKLVITLASSSNSQTNWTLSGSALTGFTGDFDVDSFGLYSFGDGAPGSMTAYIDDNAVGTASAVPEPAAAPMIVIALAFLLRLSPRLHPRPAGAARRRT